MECLAVSVYLKGDHIRVPNLGTIRCRGRLLPEGQQKALRVIRRTTGWYAQIVLDDGLKSPEKKFGGEAVGIERKAEDAGVRFVAVNSRGTSQECPNCGVVKSKELSERTHSCSCGLVCDRDHAAARVILARALAVAGATRPWTDPAADSALVVPRQAGRRKREVAI